MTTPQLDAFGTGYLRLALEIDKHNPGYVDAYIGPSELKEQVAAGEKKEPAALLDDLRALEERKPAGEPGREKYLSAYLRAMDCTIQMLAGERFEYLDEVWRLYDVRPSLVPEEDFTRANQLLDDLLPGSGELGQRYNDWRDQYDIPAEKLPELLDLVTSEVQNRTQEFVDLIPGESVEYVYLQGKPWPANNAYQGEFVSRIEINTEIPVNALTLVSLCAHECYPGHHTEAQLKEKYLYLDKGYAEEAAMLLLSPAGVTAEAIATTATEIIFPDYGQYEWTVENIMPKAGLPGADAKHLKAIDRSREDLRFVNSNAAIKYHGGELHREQTIDYLRTYALMSEMRAEKLFEFITHPLYRSYIFSYSEGYKLLEQAAMGSNKRPVFEWLLVEQVLPSDLAGEE